MLFLNGTYWIKACLHLLLIHDTVTECMSDMCNTVLYSPLLFRVYWGVFFFFVHTQQNHWTKALRISGVASVMKHSSQMKLHEHFHSLLWAHLHRHIHAHIHTYAWTGHQHTHAHTHTHTCWKTNFIHRHAVLYLSLQILLSLICSASSVITVQIQHIWRVWNRTVWVIQPVSTAT